VPPRKIGSTESRPTILVAGTPSYLRFGRDSKRARCHPEAAEGSPIRKSASHEISAHRGHDDCLRVHYNAREIPGVFNSVVNTDSQAAVPE
jgi:hypothetical protein